MSETRGAVDRVDTRPQDFLVGEREVIAALRTENAALKERLDTEKAAYLVAQGECVNLKERLEAMTAAITDMLELAVGCEDCGCCDGWEDAHRAALGAAADKPVKLPPCCDKHAPLNYGDCPSGPCACGCGDEP